MKTTTETEISTEDRLAFELSEIIGKKQQDLLRVTNSGLVTLFWTIGKTLNQYTHKNERAEYSGSVIHAVSLRLTGSYGPYFTEKHLKKMRRFNDQYPDLSGVEQVAPFVSWEHILLLLRIKDPEAKLYYVWLALEHGLSVSGLRKQLSADSFGKPKAFKGRKDRERVVRNDPVIKNFFKEPLLSSFRPLLEPSKGPLIRKNTKTPGIEEELFGVVSQQIEKYRYRQNRWLNSHLNSSFREIGKRINQEILLNKNERIHREPIMHHVSMQLKKKYGKTVSKKLLNEMATYAEQFPDPGIASRISYLATWQHILALLPLPETEAKLFYARLTATHGLSVTALRKQIAKNVYEQTSGAKGREQSIMTALRNPRIKKTKGNVTISIIYMDLEDTRNDMTVTNIFKNPYLPLISMNTTK